MSNKTVCLIMCTPKGERHVPPFPLMFLSKSLKNAGFECKIFHIESDKIDSCVEQIIQINPLFAGFSVLTGLPTLYSAEMSKKIKQKSKIPVVWGGVHTSLLPEQCIKEDYINIVSIGEGEETIVELAKSISGDGDLDAIKGIGYKHNGESVFTPKRDLVLNLSNYRFDMEAIDWNEYIQTQSFTYKGKKIQLRNAGYYGSRGCPHNCGFCFNRGYYNSRYREHPIKHVLEDIEYLKKNYAVEKIHFWDDNFFTKKDRALEILKKIDLYSGIEIRIDYITDEMAKNLSDLRVLFLLIGAESGSDRMLNLISKGFTVDKMREGIKNLAKYHIPALYSFIIAYPTEKVEELHATLDFMEEVSRIHPESSFTVGAYLPYPGTELYNLCISEGFAPPQKTEDWNLVDRWKNSVNLPWLDPKLALNIRHLFYFLTAGNKLFKEWARFRIKNKILYFDWDIKAMIKLSSLIKR